MPDHRKPGPPDMPGEIATGRPRIRAARRTLPPTAPAARRGALGNLARTVVPPRASR